VTLTWKNKKNIGCVIAGKTVRFEGKIMKIGE